MIETPKDTAVRLLPCSYPHRDGCAHIGCACHYRLAVAGLLAEEREHAADQAAQSQAVIEALTWERDQAERRVDSLSAKVRHYEGVAWIDTDKLWAVGHDSHDRLFANGLPTGKVVELLRRIDNLEKALLVMAPAIAVCAREPVLCDSIRDAFMQGEPLMLKALQESPAPKPTQLSLRQSGIVLTPPDPADLDAWVAGHPDTP